MSEENRYLALALVCMAALLFLLYSVRFCVAHDYEHPEQDAWYRSLMQPDAPSVSCCGESDAYWCDDVYTREGKTYCRITDDRDNAPMMRRPVPIGTEIFIPDYKYKHDRGNPTGHAIVFLSSSNFVWCFVQNGGV